MYLPQSYGDEWKLLTPANIQIRQIWPWGYSIQKIIAASEPRRRRCSNLIVASDFSGDHPKATHLIYSYLIFPAGNNHWFSAMRDARRRLLPDGRTMSYKRLDDSQRQEALFAFLSNAANLDGHLVAVAVDKKKKWLSTMPGEAGRLQKGFGFKSRWQPRAFESMLRKTHFPAIFLSLLSTQMGNVTWITDEDEFVANDLRHDDALIAAARMCSLYSVRPMGTFALETTRQDTEYKDYEDLCAIPDLAAGMLSEVATCLSKEPEWDEQFRKFSSTSRPQKAEIIAEWFWDNSTILRKTLISIDTKGKQYAVRKIEMHS